MVVPVPFRPSPMGPPLLAVASDALAVLASLSADRPHGVARALGGHHMTTIPVSDLPGSPLLAAPGVESPVPPTVETTPGDPAYDEHVDVSGADADVWHIEGR